MPVSAVSNDQLPSAPFDPMKICPSRVAKDFDQSPKMYLPAQSAFEPR